ncbi:MAG: spore germination protein [Phycisphaera sp.]|nr:spore germination protein [Phycisphaera sp.]
MLCRGCHYSLIGLAAGSCPECGHPFDPADPRTFVTDLLDQLRGRLFMVGGGLVVALAGIALYCFLSYQTELVLIVMAGTAGLFGFFLGVGLRRTPPSIPLTILSVSPSVIMVGLFYSLAVHMRTSFNGWPGSIGTGGFPPALETHASIAGGYFSWMILVLFAGWPIGFLSCLLVRRWNPGLFYLGVTAISFALGTGVMALAPSGFLNWWWD